MKWEITTAPASRVVTWTEAKAHNHYPDADQTAVEPKIDAATDYAEDAMECSLIERTITATYYEGERIQLPRGPLIEVQSVTDDDGDAITDYEVQRVGHSDRLKMNESFTYPLTVVYTAGYGSTGAAIPASIRQAILAHVGTLYENRESTSPLTIKEVPHGSLESFYRLKRRGLGIG